MSFSKQRFSNYQEKNWPRYEEIMRRNSNILIKKHEVNEDSWSALDDWRLGDAVWESNGRILNRDMKAGGNWGFAVKETQINDAKSEIDYFDFYDLQNYCIYPVTKKALKESYDKSEWYQSKNENVDDAKNKLSRFSRETIQKITSGKLE